MLEWFFNIIRTLYTVEGKCLSPVEGHEYPLDHRVGTLDHNPVFPVPESFDKLRNHDSTEGRIVSRDRKPKRAIPVT